jgi:hypothetical protein
MIAHLLVNLVLAGALAPSMARHARRLGELRAMWGTENVDPLNFRLYDAQTGHPFRMVRRPGGGWAKTSAGT